MVTRSASTRTVFAQHMSPVSVMGALVFCAILAVIVWHINDPKPGTNGCVAGAAHDTLAIVIDTTDPLLAGSMTDSLDAISEAMAGLKPGDRVVVTELDGAVQSAPAPLVDACLPLLDSNLARHRMRDRIETPLREKLATLAKSPASETTPLIETVLYLAGERRLNGPTSRLSILLITDGLQNSPIATAYHRRGPFAPPKDKQALTGATVTFFLIRNPRDFQLQPAGVHHLVEWLRQAGATVAEHDPPWMMLAE
jgi:hypothetical protein